MLRLLLDSHERRPRRWAAVFGGVLGVSIFGWMLYFLARNFGELRLDWSSLRPAYAIVSLVLVVITYAAFIAAWQPLAEHAGLHATTKIHAIRWGLSLLGKYVPGKVWQAVGRLALYTERANWYAGTGAILIEALVQLGLGASVGGALLLFALPRVPVWMPAASIALGVTVFICLAAHPMRDVVAETIARLGFVRQPAPMPISIISSVIGWDAVAYGAMLLGYISIVKSMGFDAFSMAPALAGGLLFAGTLGLLAFFVPAGLGIREGMLAWILLGWVSPTNAVLLALLSRLWLMTGEAIIIAAASVALVHHRRSRAAGD